VAISIVPIINLPGISAGQMVLSGQVLSKISLGEITKWNDRAIKALNPRLNLPATAILTVHRADGSGTTFNFANYLSKVNPDWASKVGADTAIEWPNGVGGKGNAGVAADVQQTVGTIGYVEYAFAMQSKLVCTDTINAAGKHVNPSMEAFPARGLQRRLLQGAGLLRNPDQPAWRGELADHCCHLHADACGLSRRQEQGGAEVPRLGAEERSGRRQEARLCADAQQRRQAD
jgi:hypothetical protein